MADWPTPGAAPSTYRAVMREGDVVWAQCTVQHLTEDEAERCAATALEQLKSNGRLPAMWVKA